MRLELTRRTDLALRAIHTLSASGRCEGGRCKATALAEAIDATVQFVPQVMGPLVRRGWVDSGPGPTGGYRLVVDPNDISLLDLIEAIEGPTEVDRCVLDGATCSGADPCALHDAWVEARNALLERLAATPVGTLAKGKRNGT